MKGKKYRSNKKVSYDTGMQNIKYPDYSSSVPTAGVQPQTDATPAVNGEGTADTVFTAPEAGTANTVNATDDLFTVDSDADTEALTQQQTEVSAAVSSAEENHGNISTEIEEYEARIQRQDEYIERLSDEIQALQVANDVLESVNQALTLHSKVLQARIEKLDTQIEANSGILGTISNGISSLFGKGVDVKALKAEKAQLEAKKAEVDAQIEANNNEISSNEAKATAKDANKTRTEECKAKNEAHAASLKEQLAPLEEKIQNGTATLEEIKAAIEAANEQNGIEASDEDVTKAALVYMDAGKKTGDNASNLSASNNLLDGLNAGDMSVSNTTPDENTAGKDDVTNSVSNFLNSADETGKCDNEELANAYDGTGISKEEAIQRVEFFETIANYEEIGVSINVADLANMTAAQLDSVVESAIVQDVIKSTSTKVMGSAVNISSKKEMQENSEATSDFIDSTDALNSYYNANDVNDFEVKAFLSLGGTMKSNISQGYVYDTSSLQQMSSNAQVLLTSLKTSVNSNENLNRSSDTLFIQEKSKTSDILDEAEKTLGNESADTDKLSECKVEFLNLTSGYNNADSDSEQASCIKLMQDLGEKGKRIKENPDSQNPYIEGSIWIAA